MQIFVHRGNRGERGTKDCGGIQRNFACAIKSGLIRWSPFLPPSCSREICCLVEINNKTERRSPDKKLFLSLISPPPPPPNPFAQFPRQIESPVGILFNSHLTSLETVLFNFWIVREKRGFRRFATRSFFFFFPFFLNFWEGRRKIKIKIVNPFSTGEFSNENSALIPRTRVEIASQRGGRRLIRSEGINSAIKR